MSSYDLGKLLHDGETVESEVDFGAGRVVVTGRRVLTFLPGTGGKNYRHVERPNVNGVTVRTRNDWGYVVKAVSAFVTAILLVGLGMRFSFDGLFTMPSGAGASVVGGMGDMIGAINTAVGLIDDAAIGLGALLALAGVVYLVGYVRNRTSVVSIDVAGEPDMDIPTKHLEDPHGTAEELRIALGFAAQDHGRDAGWNTG